MAVLGRGHFGKVGAEEVWRKWVGRPQHIS